MCERAGCHRTALAHEKSRRRQHVDGRSTNAGTRTSSSESQPRARVALTSSRRFSVDCPAARIASRFAGWLPPMPPTPSSPLSSSESTMVELKPANLDLPVGPYRSLSNLPVSISPTRPPVSSASSPPAAPAAGRACWAALICASMPASRCHGRARQVISHARVRRRPEAATAGGRRLAQHQAMWIGADTCAWHTQATDGQLRT